MQCKKEYELLLNNGELLEMYPMLSGIWLKDKSDFTEMFNQNKDIYNTDTNYDEF